MQDTQAHRFSEEPCPKRLWVMLSLADDESGEAEGSNSVTQRSTSHLLRAHLAHCPSCKEMADRVLGVQTELAELGSGSPDSRQLQSILSRGLAAAAEQAGCASLDEAESGSGWRKRLAHWLLNPRPRRFGSARAGIPLRRAIAALVGVVVLSGGYFAYRQESAWLGSQSNTAEHAEGRPWIQIPTLPEIGMSDQLSRWETKVRSPFDTIQGWKGPSRRLGDSDLNIEWSSLDVTTAGHHVLTEENGTEAQADAKIVARHAAGAGAVSKSGPTANQGAESKGTVKFVESVPTAKVPAKPSGLVDTPPPAVLSKGLKDGR